MSSAKPVKIDPDDRTVLIGSDAEIAGPLKIAWARPGTFGFWEGWSRAGDGMTWTVHIAAPGEYEIHIVALGGEASPSIEVQAGGKVFRATLGPHWDRAPVGRARFPRGRSRIVLRSVGDRQPQRFYSLELVRPSVRKRLRRRAETLKADSSWMVDGIYGLMFHWTPRTCPRRGPKKPYQQAVDEFPVERFARTVANTGAAYIYLTTAHVVQCFPGPNAALDRILPGRTCRRDLVGELAEALEARGVRLCLYYHLGHEDREWWNRVGYDRVGKEKFYRAWCAVVKDAGRRYGRHVAGWWFDDGLFSYYPINPPWERLLLAGREGYRQRLILWNSWNGPKVTDFTDLAAWEPYLTDERIAQGRGLPRGGDGRFRSGMQEGLQAQITTLIQPSWEHGKPNTPVGKCLYTTERLIAWLKEAARRRAIVTLNLEIFQDGSISAGDIRRFRAVRKAVKPSKQFQFAAGPRPAARDRGDV